MFSLLLKKDAIFIQTDKHTKELNVLKEICKKISKMIIFQDEDDLILFTDVSDHW